MNVLILVASYPPGLDSAARLYSQLAESLVQAGHGVTVISEHPAEGRLVDRAHSYFTRSPADDKLNGVRVLRVSPLMGLAKVPGGKALRFLFSCALFAGRGLLMNRQDVVLVYSPPLFMGVAGYLLSKRHRARLVLNVQDIHPKVLFDSQVIRNPVIKAILRWMEGFNYRKAYSFIVYSCGTREYLIARRVKGQIHVIPNWVDHSAFDAAGAEVCFRKEEGIDDRLLVSYVGTMDSAQGLDVVVAAADMLRSDPNIVFFLAGEGPAKKKLAETIESMKLPNVLLRPSMAASRYLSCLQESDVSLVTLGAEVPPETVPGKLAYAMACGTPILAAVNLAGDAADAVRQAEAGLCVSPGDARGLANAVVALHKDPALRRELGGRAARYAVEHFSRQSCTQQYEQVLIAAANGPAMSPPWEHK